MVRFKSSYPEHQIYEDAVILYTTPGYLVNVLPAFSTPEVVLIGRVKAVTAYLEAAAAPTALVADKLDVILQTRIGRASDYRVDPWVNVLHFTQINGTDADPTIVIDKLLANTDQATFKQGVALAAGSKRHLIGEAWRVQYYCTDGGGGTQAFGFQVGLIPM